VKILYMKNNLYFLNALLNGSSKEIQELYNANFPKVKHFIIQNKGQIADAEDVFNKALLQITVRYRKEKFQITSSFEAYLFTACKNLWRRELNKSKIKVTNNPFYEPKDDSTDLALGVLEQKRWELFHENIKLISENCKKVLNLFFAKVTYGDIMKEMNYNTETVTRQRVFRCKTKLGELIKKDQRYNSLREL